MTPQGPQDLSGYSMLELFRMETETQVAILTEGLLALESDPRLREPLESLMRAAHSLKGAARLVNLNAAVNIAHMMEDCFVEVQNSGEALSARQIDGLLHGTDLMMRIARSAQESSAGEAGGLAAEIDTLLQEDVRRVVAEPESPAELRLPVNGGTAARPRAIAAAAAAAAAAASSLSEPTAETKAEEKKLEPEAVPEPVPEAAETRVASAGSRGAVRVTAHNLDILLKLSGEAVVASRRLSGFARQLTQLRRQQTEMIALLAGLDELLADAGTSDRMRAQIVQVQEREAVFAATLVERLGDLDGFDRRLLTVSDGLYRAVLDCRMRPFSSGVGGFARMVRDIARKLNKEVSFVIEGRDTLVDREILDKMEAPLGHLLRNCLDHGIETPEERQAAGKAATGHLHLEARHVAGSLLIAVEDDGRGIDIERVRAVVIERGLVTAAMGGSMTSAELLEFLFLPGFSMKGEVTEVSGRGVGLDVVLTQVKEVGGSVRVLARNDDGGSEAATGGTRIELRLPLALSVLRALIVEIGGEPYAFPLSRVSRALKLTRDAVESVEGRQHFRHGAHQVGLVAGNQVLGLDGAEDALPELTVLVLGEDGAEYGVVVDRFIGEEELVVRPLDDRLGKVQDISAAALMANQAPVLIVDVDDFVRSIDLLASGGRLAQIARSGSGLPEKQSKRVLVVDDSLTVRELERKLIAGRGYLVEVAVDGMDAWNAVRTGHYDLVVTDVDMPRLDGIELVTLIKKDARLQRLPVMIVSYKDREEDRRRGLEAGADYYLAKASFHDETLLLAIEDLIGEAQS